MAEMRLELAYPPSINNYFRKYRNRMVISREGRLFRRKVCSALSLLGAEPMKGELVMIIYAYPPDRRKRDIDNIQKPLLDALEKGGAFVNDNQVKDLRTVMNRPEKGGRVIVTISQRELSNGKDVLAVRQEARDKD